MPVLFAILLVAALASPATAQAQTREQAEGKSNTEILKELEEAQRKQAMLVQMSDDKVVGVLRELAQATASRL